MKSYYTILVLFLLLGFQGLFSQDFKQREVEPNTFQTLIKVDGVNRQFLVHLPPSYNPKADQIYPVVFMFHGGGGSGQKYYNTSKWKEVGDREGIITVFPTALSTCIIKEGKQSTKRYWMTDRKQSSVCPGTTAQDDIAFVKAIVDHLKSNYQINDQKIYASGFSNGMGLILSQLMVEMGDTFAAFAGVGSLVHQSYPVSNPQPVFSLVGQNDSHMDNWAGITAPIADVHELLDETELGEKVDFILKSMNLEAKYVERDRPKYILRRYEQTTDGGNQELRFGILKGLGHVYPHGGPNHNDIIIAEVFWEFFQEF